MTPLAFLKSLNTTLIQKFLKELIRKGETCRITLQHGIYDIRSHAISYVLRGERTIYVKTHELNSD